MSKFAREKKTFIFIGSLAVLVLLTGYIRQADAGFWSDLFSSTSRKSSSSLSTITAPKNEPQTLYKPVAEYEKSVVDAVKKASPAVVSITISKNVPIIESCQGVNPFFMNIPPEFRGFFGDIQGQGAVPCQKGEQLQEVGGGSGFIIATDGLIVTNKHVVNDQDASYTVLTNDGKKYPAKVLARDPSLDIAIIKIDAKDLASVELGDSDAVELGQTAIAIGNALGEFRNTVSVGVISGLSRTITASGANTIETIKGLIQTDAAINPGNSGGPLLNLKGQVIAINTAVASNAQSVGFAIPINRAKRDIESVRATGKIEPPFIGVRYLIVMPEIAKKQGLSVEYGALVRGSDEGPAVVAGGPADKAGVLAEDIILEFNGKKIDNDGTLSDHISQTKVGDIVQLKILRKGNEMRSPVTIGKRPS